MAPSQLKRLKEASRNRKHQISGPSRRSATNSNHDKSQKLRSQTLLAELRTRHKVGGITDRRIGENDPDLAPEERSLRRYAAETQKSKRASIFNLDDLQDDHITHLGQPVHDRLNRSSLSEEETGDLALDSSGPLKRARSRDDDSGPQEKDAKRSKKEIMREVIAKSKLYKYERQQEKDEDYASRLDLDKDLPELLSTLRQKNAPRVSQQDLGTNFHPDRLALVSADKVYDQRVREMIQEKKAKPSERTKSEQEKAQAEKDRVRALEQQRIERMHEAITEQVELDGTMRDEREDEAIQFGLSSTQNASSTQDEMQQRNAEEEDDFELDTDLIASGSDIDVEMVDNESLDLESTSGTDHSGQSDEKDYDMDFIQDLMPRSDINGKQLERSRATYTYSCPQTVQGVVDMLGKVSEPEISRTIQRLRALHNPQLHSDNKNKLSLFASALVGSLKFLTATLYLQWTTIESIIRHIHSLSRSFNDTVAEAFRTELMRMLGGDRDEGDLIIFIAIGSVYSTSDHFHQVVTPAITIICRWLASDVYIYDDFMIGAFLVSLAIHFSKVSQRYVPEALRYSLAALENAPTEDIRSRHLKNVSDMMDLWVDKTAFIELFHGFSKLAITNAEIDKKLHIMLKQAEFKRRSLELHHHKPLSIKMSVPRFEESFNPDKHYDPDRERAENNRLRKEFRSEKKGALRELRKDADFIAREKLRDKRERDKAYETKQRRIIAEIQGDEGRERNAYIREKRSRKSKN